MANPAIPIRLSQIDQLSVAEYWYLDNDDECYYLWERVSGARYDEYPTNDLIKNLQIPPAFRGQNRWYWKERAIEYAAKAVGGIIPEDWRQRSTIVPVPPSLVKDDLGHDARLLSVLHSIRPRLQDVRELILQKENAVSKEKHIPPEVRADNYRINEGYDEPEPAHIVIFDDVLTTGSHFKGAVMVLRERYPDVNIVGLFLARAIHPNVVPTVADDINL